MQVNWPFAFNSDLMIFLCWQNMKRLSCSCSIQKLLMSYVKNTTLSSPTSLINFLGIIK
jgi:hypothetical protein